MKHLTSIKDVSNETVEKLYSAADKFTNNPYTQELVERTVAHIFFEPSTRTLLSFNAAVQQLGGKSIGFPSVKSTSLAKGESFSDTIKVLQNYADAIIIRHNQSGKAQEAADIAAIPIINAGDGSNEHPTQALIDVYTIKQSFPSMDNLTVALVGDLKYSRSMHSLVMLLQRWNISLIFISPSSLMFPDSYLLHNKNIEIADTIHDVIGKVDVLYMQRLQKERFATEDKAESYDEKYILTTNLVKKGKDSLMILDPLPRIDEIDHAVDDLPQAKYFQQAKNGLAVRKAILQYLLQ